jgi:hypothetical protein
MTMTISTLDELNKAKKDKAEAIARIANLEKALTIEEMAEFKKAMAIAHKFYKDKTWGGAGSIVWKDKELVKYLKDFGLIADPAAILPTPAVLESESDMTSEGEGVPKERKPRSDLNKDEVREFIKAASTPTVGQVKEHFRNRASKVTVGVRIKELLNAGEITKEEAEKGNSKILRAV